MSELLLFLQPLLGFVHLIIRKLVHRLVLLSLLLFHPSLAVFHLFGRYGLKTRVVRRVLLLSTLLFFHPSLAVIHLLGRHGLKTRVIRLVLLLNTLLFFHPPLAVLHLLGRHGLKTYIRRGYRFVGDRMCIHESEQFFCKVFHLFLRVMVDSVACFQLAL